jgi:hypothetical protein
MEKKRTDPTQERRAGPWQSREVEFAIMPTPENITDEARRHGELIAALWRLQTTLEGIYQLNDRQLRAVNGLEARLEAALPRARAER